MSYLSFYLHLWWRILLLAIALLVNKSFELNADGVLLLSFKHSILSDPLAVLDNWSYHDETPCSWNGVTCGTPSISDANYRVTGLSLPNSKLLGSISADLGMIQHLQILDLSNNSINGSIPFSLYDASELRILDLSGNLITGEVSELVGGLKSLESLNFSDNAFVSNIPESLTRLHNLTVVSLKINYFSGVLRSGFDSVRILDLSSNLINGSLPLNFGSSSIQYLNVSYNRLSGEIPPEFANKLPANATIDLSFNNLTGEVPELSLFYNQASKMFAGNPELCGKPLKNLCPIPSSMSTISAPTSPPAIAAIPKSNPAATAASQNGKVGNGLKIGTVIGIVVGDIAGIGILALIFIYVYQAKKKKSNNSTESAKEFDWASSSSDENKWLRSWACILKRRKDGDESSSESSSSESGEDTEKEKQKAMVQEKNSTTHHGQGGGSLVTVDGEKEMEVETLLKASAYILGATGSSIMYKAVLEDGTALAVRRIGESGLERFRDFENQVRAIAKLVHPNLVRIRGFYWGADEKLVIYDFVPNGSLANARYRKAGSSPCSLPWEVRLKIAKGIARGLTYIHEKKHVHGNLKPTNILLGSDMEPKIGDFGLERLLSGENSYKASGSARNFGSKRSSGSRDSFQDIASGTTPSPSPSSMAFCISPYYAPESLRSLKPNPKWDIYSFGVVLLELLTGKVIVSDELCPGTTLVAATLEAEEKTRVLRMADVAIRADMEGKEEALLSILRLGYNCISPMPQKRPPMKEVLHVLEKFTSFPPPSSYYYGH